MENDIKKKLDQFFSQFTFLTYQKGDVFIHADEPPAGIFYLTKGLVRQYIITSKGEDLTVNIYKPLSFFPMMWAINETENLFYFEAMGDIEMWRAPKEEVVGFIKNEPDVLYDLLSRLYKGVDGLLARMTYLMAGNARAKIIFTILNVAYRFAITEKDIDINLAITHKDLAAISGTTRETFSREIKKLEKAGLVSLKKGTIHIPSQQKLEEELMSINQHSPALE